MAEQRTPSSEPAESIRTLRLFVSSPSDVRPERDRVELVAARLNAQLQGRIKIDVLRWENNFYSANRSFQEAIDAAVAGMTGTDIVVCIVWKRVGLELNPKIWHRPDGTPFEGGTVYEYETAIEVSRRSKDGVPDIYLFRKGAPVSYDAEGYEEQARQHRLLEAVVKRWTETDEGHNAAASIPFKDPDDFETKLELCLKQWLERRGIQSQQQKWDRSPTADGSPFRGLAAFEQQHSAIFFGRDSEINRAISKLRQVEQSGFSFLLVSGPSGSGKSSLLRAGLMPRLALPGTIDAIENWRTALVLPSSDPVLNLAEALFADDALGHELADGDIRTAQMLARQFHAEAKIAVAVVAHAVERAARKHANELNLEEPRPTRLLLSIDQAERLFVEATPDKVAVFASVVCSLFEERIATGLVTLRSDAMPEFQKVADFAALMNKGAALYLLPPSEAELEDMVVRPVMACHPPLAFEQDTNGRSLAEVLVRDAKGGDALPLLQMTLQRLYEAEEQHQDGVLRYADYPGFDVAVAKTADEVFGSLEEREKSELPALITAMVRDVTTNKQTGESFPVVIPLDRAQFVKVRNERAKLVDAFVEARLLITEARDNCVSVRPVHEALFRTWPEAAQIIEQNSELIRVRHMLEPMAAEWSRAPENTKDEYLIKSPSLLTAATELDRRFGDDLNSGNALLYRDLNSRRGRSAEG